jgi:phosphohistidine phosphatase
MEICIIRHGVAEERGPRWPDDAARPLTADGVARMAQAAAGLATLVRPAVVLSSPYVRAWQTANLVADACRSRLVGCEALASGDDTELFATINRAAAPSVAVVGHEPHVSTTLSLLLVGGDGLRAAFKKGAAALVQCERAGPGVAWLEWYLPPAALRALAR